MQKVALDGAHVRLEPLEERHRELMRPAAQHPEIFTVTTSAYGKLFDPYIDAALKRSDGVHELAFAVFHKELGRHVGSSLPPESRHTFVLDWFIDTISLEDGALVYRVVGADFVNTDVCFFCRSEQEARTLLALVDGVCTTHTVIKTQLRR